VDNSISELVIYLIIVKEIILTNFLSNTIKSYYFNCYNLLLLLNSNGELIVINIVTYLDFYNYILPLYLCNLSIEYA